MKVGCNHTGSSQATRERESRRTDDEPLRNNAGIHTGGKPPRGLLYHLLLFLAKLDDLSQALVSERQVALIAHSVHSQSTRFRTRLEHRPRDISGRRARIHTV